MATFKGDKREGNAGIARKKCMVCGKRKSDVFWAGHKTIQFCSSCTLDILPMLAADATLELYPMRDSPETAKAALHHLAERYWRGAYYQEWRRRNARK